MSQKQIINPRNFHWLDYKRYTFSLGVEKKGVMFMSGESASQYDPGLGRVVCNGGIPDHARVAFEKLGTVLEAAGAGFENVVKLGYYVAPGGLAEYCEVAAVRKEYFKSNWPASTGIVVERLLRPDALIEIDAVAVLDSKSEAINPGWPRYDQLAFSPAVRAGDLLWLSGFIGLTEGSGVKTGEGSTTSQQTEAIYRTIGTVLEAGGASPGEVVKSTDFIAPDCVESYGSTNEARRKFYRGTYPAYSGVVVNRMKNPEVLIEVDTVAVIGGQRQEVSLPGWTAPYSDMACPSAVRNGKFLFLSGQTGIDPNTGNVVGEGDIIAQARQAYDNIQKLIESTGGTMKDIVKTTEFILSEGLENYRAVGDLRREIFQDGFPAATGVVVNSLLRPGMLIQVDAVAILD